MEQPRPKKRRRHSSKPPAESTDASRPLLTTKFSISVDAARHDEATKETKGDLSFAIVRTRAEALGGTYSATVHRNVGVLLASSGAASRKTQRVRKAAKLGVAIVDAAPFLDACEAGAGPDTDAHALRVAADDAPAAAADGTAADGTAADTAAATAAAGEAAARRRRRHGRGCCIGRGCCSSGAVRRAFRAGWRR